jgi:hypothetical protein
MDDFKPTVEYWEPDNTWCVRWGSDPVDAWYGIVDEGLAVLLAVAMKKGFDIGFDEGAQE